ncbi:hypothetical protein MKX01_001374 [Papaver californicum]|nr:hypothetical protein MKX01_001374 [Papaver californicum]
MAKAAHLSLSPFLIGFLLVLFVADIGSVRGECDVGTSVNVESCDNCDSLCISESDFLVNHTECRYVPVLFGHLLMCLCCR